MIGSVNMNVSQVGTNLYSNATSQVKSKAQSAPEQTESPVAETLESRRMQASEKENRTQSADLLNKLQQTESRQVYAMSDQIRANAQANQVNGMRAYSAAGKSEFNFA